MAAQNGAYKAPARAAPAAVSPARSKAVRWVHGVIEAIGHTDEDFVRDPSDRSQRMRRWDPVFQVDIGKKATTSGVRTAHRVLPPSMTKESQKIGQG